jgi:hypothetical protein
MMDEKQGQSPDSDIRRSWAILTLFNNHHTFRHKTVSQEGADVGVAATGLGRVEAKGLRSATGPMFTTVGFSLSKGSGFSFAKTQ